VLVAGAVAGAVVIAAALLWPITDLIAAHDVGLIAGPQRAMQLRTAREAVRTQLLTLAAGVFVAWALWYTAQNFRLSRQGQVTDRYTRAIEQLGSNKLDVRIGAIYALERVARDSPKDHPTVMEVLTAFIREHSREPWPRSTEAEDKQGPYEPSRTRPDVQAAATVIGRRDPRHDHQPLDLSSAYLADADLIDANLNAANLSGANLYCAHLQGANLSHVYLADANLNGAYLNNANLTGADLFGTDLNSANLTGADLNSANLFGADLPTDLFGADLTGAKLGVGQPIPEGWQRDPGSGRLSRSAPSADGS
jgi:hypothetical protein